MLKEWSDEDFGYDRERDLYTSDDYRHIQRPDKVTLYCVPEFKWGALYTVHLCAKAKEVWTVSTSGLRSHIWNDEGWRVCYVPRERDKGQPTARGYLVPCSQVRNFGQRFDMPGGVQRRLLAAKTKSEAGLTAERAFHWFVTTDFFRGLFVPPVEKSTEDEDKRRGIDFWAGDTPVQVKFDGPGGARGTGNLFFQTHTLSVGDCEKWHGFEY